MNYSIIGNELIVNEIPIKFSAPIDKAELFNNILIVMLQWQKDDPFDFTNALYAVSEKGTILWRMQNVREFLPPLVQPAPLVDVSIYEGNIYPFDCCAKKYHIDPTNGKILDLTVGRW